MGKIHALIFISILAAFAYFSLILGAASAQSTNASSVNKLPLKIGNLFPNTYVASAQTFTAFTTETAFNIPELNGTIYFAINGSYSRALLDNNTWIFSDLQLYNSQTLKAFNVSVQNCNMTIILSERFSGYFNAQNNTAQGDRSGRVEYNVTGHGIQTFNFGLSPSFGLTSRYRDLIVWFNIGARSSLSASAMGNGWQISRDGTITVTNATTGVTISYLDYSQEFTNANISFYQRHSVTITAAALVAAIVIVGLVLKLNSQKNRHAEGNK
jgi:hypothetical protein